MRLGRSVANRGHCSHVAVAIRTLEAVPAFTARSGRPGRLWVSVAARTPATMSPVHHHSVTPKLTQRDDAVVSTSVYQQELVATRAVDVCMKEK